MSEVSYSNVPPMMAAIKSGDIEAIRSLLHAGHSPNEPQCYHVMIGDWPRDDEASPLELAVLENRMDMVCGNVAVIGNGEFRALSGKVDGFILYADTLRYENGAKLSRDEQENLKCLYQHFVLNREDFIDWDI